MTMTVTSDVPVTPLLDPDELPLLEDDEAPLLELDAPLELPDDVLLPPPDEPLPPLLLLLAPPLELEDDPCEYPVGEEPPQAAATARDKLANKAIKGSFMLFPRAGNDPQ